MSEIIQSAKSTMWEWRVALLYAFLFSFTSLGTAVLASLQGVEWETLDTQAKVTVIIAVAVNWCQTLMAFVSKQSQRIQKTGQILPTDDTQFLSKPASTDATKEQNK